MLITILFIGAFLSALGFILNVNNAPYLLSGYNTLSAEEREKIDIDSLVRCFRQFHRLFGLVFIAIGLASLKLFGEYASTYVVIFFPILAYLYFLLRTRKYIEGSLLRLHRLGIYVLLSLLIVLIVIFFFT